eukprot:5160301-Amphidinium_carterae.1
MWVLNTIETHVDMIEGVVCHVVETAQSEWGELSGPCAMLNCHTKAGLGRGGCVEVVEIVTVACKDTCT